MIERVEKKVAGETTDTINENLSIKILEIMKLQRRYQGRDDLYFCLVTRPFVQKDSYGGRNCSKGG
jgi:hypothetical protein